MYADLQDDPKEIASFLALIEVGADCVTGWKQVRNDPVDKTMPSKVFNGVMNRVFGLSINDHNCGFKAYRRETLDDLDLYGELHRFIPALLHARGYRVEQVAVEHRARQFGKSKFGTKRLLKGALDLLTICLTTRFGARPLHLFGGAGLVLGGLGTLIVSYLTVAWIAGESIGQRPLLVLGVLLILFGGQLVSAGLLGELFLRRTISEKDKYAIREVSGSLFTGLEPVRTFVPYPEPTAAMASSTISEKRARQDT